MNIVLWADLQCPFCFAGETNLQHAIEELKIEDQVNMDIKSREIHRPEDGNGDHEMLEIFQVKDEFTPEGAKKQIGKINHMIESETGTTVDFGQVRESNDFNAHRLYKLARDRGCGQAVRDALHEAYFIDHKILDDKQTLIEAGMKGGLARETIERMLEEGWYANEVKNDEMEYDALGIESVPYFIIDQEVVPEHLTKEAFMDVLKRHM